jgi:hypothetical protein
MLPRSQIEELNVLSKEVLGVSSKWRKLMDKGETTLAMEETTVYDPEAPEGEQEKKQMVPLYHHTAKGNKMLKYEIKRYATFDAVKARLLEIREAKENLRKILEEQRVQQEEAKKLEASKEIVAQAAGSSTV